MDKPNKVEDKATVGAPTYLTRINPQDKRNLASGYEK
jgi:hypothetical protein